MQVPSESEQVCKPAAYVNGTDFSVQKWRPGAGTAILPYWKLPYCHALTFAELPDHPS